MDALSYFLGIHVVLYSFGLFLQQKYVVKILEQACMLNYNPSRTLAEPVEKLGVTFAPLTILSLYRSLAKAL